MSEMKLLYQKAFSFIGNSPMHPFSNFFRSKPKNYWNKICSTPGKIMEIYPKDSNGQAASPINQNIQGNFIYNKMTSQNALFNLFEAHSLLEVYIQKILFHH